MIDTYKDEIIEIIMRYFPNAKIYLFGSRARKTHQEGSDIDLALDVGKKIDLNTIQDIKADIDETTTMPLFVDIVDMHSIPEQLKEEILKDGVIWKN